MVPAYSEAVQKQILLEARGIGNLFSAKLVQCCRTCTHELRNLKIKSWCKSTPESK